MFYLNVRLIEQRADEAEGEWWKCKSNSLKEEKQVCKRYSRSERAHVKEEFEYGGKAKGYAEEEEE